MNSHEVTVTQQRGAGSWGLCAVIGCVWIVVLPQLIPGSASGGDHGTFVSVAERLIAGDRLYVDVWDNKDPLFYGLLALARSVTDLGDAILEIAWVALACVATSLIVRSGGGGPRRARFAGWALAPLVLTGTAYRPGMTHLPGIAVTVAILALVLRGRWVAMGLAMSMLAFLKLTMLPVAVTLVLVVVLTRRETKGLLRGVASAVGAGGLFLGLLAVRGELVAYVTTQQLNMSYSSNQLIGSRWGGAVGHLLRVIPADMAGNSLVTIAATCLILLLAGQIGSRGESRSAAGAIALGAWWSLVAAIGVLALTGIWVHHGQILYVPGILAVTVFTLRAPRSSLPQWREAAALLAAPVLVGGVGHPYTLVTALRELPSSVASISGPSPESVALMAVGPHGRYARLGTNDVNAHARGLSSWTLGCPPFTQYPFDPPATFEDALACLPTVDAVLVMDSFAPQQGEPAWNDFVARARTVLSSEFACRNESFGELCLRR